MRAVPLGPSVEPFLWGHEALFWVGETQGARAVLGWWRTHAGGTTGTFCGAPVWGHEALYWVGETKGTRAVKGGGGRMRAVPLDLRWGPLMGPRSAVLAGEIQGARVVLVVADASGRCRWGL
eukprot:7213408-Pyramimonas_sp.AAC.1